MTATQTQINRIRGWLDEATTASSLADADIKAAVEEYPLPDTAGLISTDTGWVATYDLNAAAALLWGDKVAKLAGNFDFSADGGSYSRSQAYDHARGREAFYMSRRNAISRVVTPDRARYNGYKLPADVVGRTDTLTTDSDQLLL